MSALPTALEALLGDTDVRRVADGLRVLLDQHRVGGARRRVDIASDDTAGWIRLHRGGQELTLRIAEVERDGDTLRRWELRSLAGPRAGRLELIAIYLTDWLHG